MTRSSLSLASLAGLVLAAGALATPAAAHDSLVSADPADGAALAEPPAAIVLEFSGDILDLNPALELEDPQGAVVEVGAALVDGATVTWELTDPESLLAGEYAVVWAVTSQDGHPIDGSFGFTVDGSWAPAEPSPEATEAEPTEAAPTEAEPTEAAPSDAAPTEPTAAEPSEPTTATPSETPADPDGEATTISSVGATWLVPGLAITALVVIMIVLALRRSRDPNGPPGQH